MACSMVARKRIVDHENLQAASRILLHYYIYTMSQKLAWVLGKHNKPFSDAEVIQLCLNANKSILYLIFVL